MKHLVLAGLLLGSVAFAEQLFEYSKWLAVLLQS
jgi:hypothetical protein